MSMYDVFQWTNDDGSKTLPVRAWVRGVEFEEEARAQVRNTASLPFVRALAVMPDCHWGMGATIGSVIATKGAIIPAAVGVDLGCGMLAVKTDLAAKDLPDALTLMRSEIEKAVPHGRTDNGGKNDRGAWHDVPEHVKALWRSSPEHNSNMTSMWLDYRFGKLCAKHPKLAGANSLRHMGTLGTGNHFIEVCLDLSDNVWVMLHSGSRGIGGQIGKMFIERAKEDMRRWFINLPDVDLAYIPEGSETFADYVEAVEWAQDFALLSRRAMMFATLSAMSKTLGREVKSVEDAVSCHHNYIAREHHFGENVIVTRKGAVRARAGDLGIIPGSMGARSFIVRGLGSEASLMSCSHGAGRKMSRTKAKKVFSLEEHAQATHGVECKKDESVLDETPGAYKEIDAVMRAQSDLVEIVAELKQCLCVKG